jgi:hypothetical protein
MRNFVDVQEGDWFYNEIMEAANLTLADGTDFISSIPYSSFNTGAPYLYEEQPGEQGKTYFHLTKLVQPTVDNPLYVYIDGVQTVYKAWYINGSSLTDVELYVSPKAGTIVSFVSLGEPSVDGFGKPSLIGNESYPAHVLDHAATYFYDPFSRRFQEYCFAFGRKLRRLTIPDAVWAAGTATSVVAAYIKDNQEVYCVSPTGTLYMPYNLNSVSISFQYTSLESGSVVIRGGTFKATAPTGNVQYNNRFFPQALITRAEAFYLVEKLRRTFYQRFSDADYPRASFEDEFHATDGQRVFKLNNRYIVGTGLLKVYVNDALVSSTTYNEFDDHTVIFNVPKTLGTKITFMQTKSTSSRFKDTGAVKSMYVTATDTIVPIGGGSVNSYWVASVMDLEEERLSDGSYLIEGFDITTLTAEGYAVVDEQFNPITGTQDPEKWFMPKTLLTRAQSAAFLNRLRKWSIDKFKV